MTFVNVVKNFLYFTLIVVALFSGTFAKDFATLDHIGSSTSPQTQRQAVQDLLQRLLDTRSAAFDVEIDANIGPKGKDTFKLLTVQGNKLQVTGTSGLAAAWGVYYYLTQYCNSQVTWGGKQVDLPPTLPLISKPLIVTSNDRFRYYQNVCTVSYSMVWWSWERWEREIDWMALSGINLPLAFNGQEAIWERVYSKMGFTDEDLNEFFSGPAFFAWQRMGNMQGFGGPLTSNWHSQQVALQHKILQRMRDLGITPVLPAFAGHVPKAITKIFPNASVSMLGDWGSMPPQYCCTALLDVEDPLFVKIGGAFLQEYIAEFGTDHIYNTDTFNEMTPKSSDPAYLKKAGEAVFGAMTVTDPDAIWLMQGWLFLEAGFWKPPQAQALLTSVPQGRMIILDLYSEQSPQYTRLESYYGQPFIWCMLHDFGGTVAMYGVSDKVNEGPFSGRTFPNSSMIGTGLTPEGINQNEVMYEMMNENSWRKEPRDLKVWFMNYPTRRYGGVDTNAQKAWTLLMRSVYNCTDLYKDHGYDTVLATRPKTTSITPNVWYDPEDVYAAWDYMLLAASNKNINNKTLFRYDLVDVTRQSLQLISIKYYNDMINNFKAKKLQDMLSSGYQLLVLLSDMDIVLGSDRHFLLGNWISDARAMGTNDQEKKQYEYNARNQVTLWGPTGNILDYANKQWSGLINGYYRQRWEYFLLALKDSIMNDVKFDQSKFNGDILKNVEQPFTFDNKTYPTTPKGDSISLSYQLHSKYRAMTKANRKFFKMLPEFSKQGPKFVKVAGKWVRKQERRQRKKFRLQNSINVLSSREL